ncbi:MAG: WD40 repeat domain-containing protein, partial [Candidatus Methylomirabilis sp.]|nr:WD40 repeat domain-containing protein [Deltaproteobacteria bacterium]
RDRLAGLARTAWENRAGAEQKVVYDLAANPPGRSLETIAVPKGEVRGVSFSDGGRYMAAAASDGNVQLWLTEDWVLHRVFKGHEAPVSHVRFGARATVLYTGGADGKIFKWDLSTGQGAEIVQLDAGVGAMAVTRDERNLAYASEVSNAIYVQDVVWGQTVRCLGHRGVVTDLAFSANGRYLASASEDGAAKYWDATGGDALGTMGDGATPVTAVALHPSAPALASGDQEGRLVLWNLDNQRRMAASTFFHAAVTDIAFAPDGKSILAAGADGRIALFGFPDLRLAGVYSEHAGPVLSLAIASKGDVFASTSSDRRVKVWPLAEGVFGQPEGGGLAVSDLRRDGPTPV